MANIAQLLTEHMDIWTAADTVKKSGRGRASGNAGSVYGVKKLRELILGLAVRGKLVPQDTNDEPASELLKRIQAEKARLIAEGKLKKETPLAVIGRDEKPFELPQGWEWQRLTDTYYSISPKGRQLKGSEIKEMGKHPVVDQGQTFISGYTDLMDLLIEIPHAIIIFGDHTTNIKLVDFDFVAGADGTKLLAPILIDPNFYYYYLQSYNLENRGYARHFKVLNDNLIAIPPLAEQHRIVAKVDELMALCDQLEQQHSNAQDAHETLVSQLLATLTQSQNATEFNANWQRIYAHFDVLFTTEASIDTLKQTLLQLAVMGKLVPQDPNDEPASELLKRIQAEKDKLIIEGKLKKEKPLAQISEDEKPFELPKRWVWVRLGNLFTFQYGDNLPEPKRTNTGEFPVYGSNGIVGTHNQCFVKSKCIVIGRKGSAGALNLSMHEGCCVTDVAYYCIPPFELDLSFTFTLFHTLGLDALSKGIKPGLNRNETYESVIAIPSLAEQRRIVAKVGDLMALCDQLKIRLQQANQQQQAIANVLVAQAVT